MAEPASQEIQKYSTLVKLQPENAENHFLLGLAFENAGQVAESNKSYDQCIKLQPRHSLAHLHRGFHLARAGDPDRALTEWNRAFDLDPHLGTKFATDPHTQREYKQKIDSSIQNFTKPILINPKNAFAHYQLGTAYKFFNLLELSLQSLKRALDINPRLHEAYHQCGEIYSLLDQNKLAITHFKMAVEANPRYADSHFQLATVYDRENQSTLAIKHLEEAIKLDADKAVYYFAFGRTLMRQTKYKVAMQQIQKGLNLDKNNARGYLLLAECCKELYRPDLALVSYERAVEQDPNFKDAIYELGTIALQLGEIDKAVTSFERALELKADDPLAHFYLAQAYHRRNDYKEAEEHYRQASELSPKDAFAAYNLGLVRQELGNPSGALDAFRKAVDLKPQDATYHLVLAKCAMGLDHNDEAVSHLREAIKLNPNDLETNFLLADVMMDMGQFDEAISMFRKVTEITPDSVDAHTRLAEAFHKLEMFDYAFESFQQALRLDSKHIPSLHGMGILYLRYRSKPSIAVDFFQQALELEPSHAPSLASLGEAYIALNQPERALQFFERKLEENRENPDYLSKYAEALALGGQTNKAIDELKRALQLSPESVLMRTTLARMFMQDKRYADALDQYQRLAQQQPKEAEHHYNLGQIHEQLGDNEKAGRAYNEALERRPDHKEAMERLEVIYEGKEIPRPRPKPVQEAAPQVTTQAPVSAGHDDDPLGNLEALLGVGSLDNSAPPPPPPTTLITSPDPEPEPEPVYTPPAPTPAPAATPAEDELSTDDLLSSLMGDMGIEASPPPPPPPSAPTPVAAQEEEDDLAALFMTDEPAAPPSPPAAQPPAPEPEPEPEPEMEQVAVEPTPEPAPVAPPAATPPPAVAEEEDDLNDFLRGLGYTEDTETVEASVPAPAPTAAVEPMEPEPMELEPMQPEPMEPEPMEPEPMEPEPQPEPEPVVAPIPEPVQEEASTSIEDLLGLTSTEEPPAAVPTSAVEESTSIEDLLGLTQDEPAVEAPQVEPQAEETSIEDLLGITAVEEAPPAAVVPEPEPVMEPEVEATPEPEPTPEPVAVVAAVEARTFEDLSEDLEDIVDFIDIGKLDKAKTKLEKLLKANPGHPEVLNLMSKVASGGEDWAGAAQYLEQEVDSRPSDAAFEQLSDAYQKLGQDDQLQATYKRWNAFNPQAERAQSAATPAFKEFEANGQWSEALGSLTEAEAGERERLFQSWRSQLEEQQDYEEALSVSKRQSEELGQDLNEDRLRLFGAWAAKEESASRWEAAAQIYQKQLSQNLGGPSALENLQRIYGAWSQDQLQQGDFEQAIQVWDKAKDVPELQTTAAEKVAALYLEWGQALRSSHDFASAITVLEQGRVIADTTAMQAEIGQTFQDWSAHWEREGDFEQAIDCLKRQSTAVGAGDPLNQQMVDLYKTWAQFLLEDGQKEAADEVYARLQGDFPDAEIPKSDPWAGHQANLQELRTAQDYATALAIVDGFLSEHPDHAEGSKMRAELHGDSLKSLREKGEWDSWTAALSESDAEEAKVGFGQRSESLSEAAALDWASHWQKWDESAAQAYRAQKAQAWVGSLQGGEAVSKAEELGLEDLKPALLEAWTQQELAGKEYEAALAKLPASEHARVYEVWSQSLEDEGDYEDSINVLNRWLAAHPEADAPQRKLVSSYKAWAEGLSDDHRETAVAVLEQLLAADFPLIGQPEERQPVQDLLDSWKAPVVEEVQVEEAPVPVVEEAPVAVVEAEEAPAEDPKTVEAPVAEEPVVEEIHAEEPPVEGLKAESAPTAGGDWGTLNAGQKAGNWEVVLAAAAALQASAPDANAYAQLLLAHADHLLDEKKSAGEIFEQVKALEGLSAETQEKLDKGQLRVKVEEALLGDDDRAEDILREMMSQDPANDTYHNALYRLHSNSSMSGRRLVDFYRDLQKSYPNEPSFLLQLARAYCNASKDTLAVVQFRKLVQIAPQAGYYVELAQTYVRLNKGGDAQKAIQSALELDANLPAALLAEVLVLIQQKDLEGAKAKAEAAKANVANDAAVAWLDNVSEALEGGKAPDDATLAHMPNLLL